jgi:hypothetical protein
VSGSEEAELSTSLRRVPGLQRTLDFFRLARTPQYERDDTTPLVTGYQASMLEYASDKLSELIAETRTERCVQSACSSIDPFFPVLPVLPVLPVPPMPSGALSPPALALATTSRRVNGARSSSSVEFGPNSPTRR